MIPLLARNWFLVALTGILVVGFFAHAAVAEVADALPRAAIIVVVLFLMALPLETSAIVQIFRRPGAALLATLVNFIVVPGLAWLCRPFLFGEFGTGLVIAAAVPTTLASAAVWTRRAGGNDAVALIVTVLTNLTCFLVTPAILWLLLRRHVAIDFGPLVTKLALLVVLPVVFAQLCRQLPRVARWADAHKFQIGVVAQCGLLSIVFVGAVFGGATIHALPDGSVIGWGDWLGLIIAVLLVHLISFAVGYFGGGWCGFSDADRTAVGFAGSQKTLMAGLAIALEFGGLAALPMVVYHVVQLLVDTAIADRLVRRRAPAKALAG